MDRATGLGLVALGGVGALALVRSRTAAPAAPSGLVSGRVACAWGYIGSPEHGVVCPLLVIRFVEATSGAVHDVPVDTATRTHFAGEIPAGQYRYAAVDVEAGGWTVTDPSWQVTVPVGGIIDLGLLNVAEPQSQPPTGSLTTTPGGSCALPAWVPSNEGLVQGTAHCTSSSSGASGLCPSDMAILFLDHADPHQATAYITSPAADGVSYKIPLAAGTYYPGVSHISWGTTVYSAGPPVQVVAGQCAIVNLSAVVPA